MTSVNKINLALSQVRGAPLGTIEAYSRGLRQAGILPQTKRGSGATPLQPLHAGYMLGAVMRGSPTNAAENAREVGNLIASDMGGMDALLLRQLTALGWNYGITFCEAIGWFVERILDGTISQYVMEGSGVEVRVDRYWTVASFCWFPTAAVVEEFVAGWLESFPAIDNPPKPARRLNGGLVERMEIEFHSPLVHERKITYKVDQERHIRVARQFSELRRTRSLYDIHGYESVTQRTLVALAEAFRSSDGDPLVLPSGWHPTTLEVGD